jgi:hypothetical protein
MANESRGLNPLDSSLITHHRNPGGAERDRTDDLLLAKQALSQLSYSPLLAWPCLPASVCVVGLGGLEPPTPRLSSVCSNQLSYRPLLATQRSALQPPAQTQNTPPWRTAQADWLTTFNNR